MRNGVSMPIDIRDAPPPSSDQEGAILRILIANQATSEPMATGAETLLHALAGAVGLAGGVLWLPERGALVAQATWAAERSEQQALESSVRGVRIAPGVGLAGRAWETCEPQTANMTASDGDPDAQQVNVPDLRSSLTVPARQGDYVLGVVELYASTSDRRGHDRSLAALRPAAHLLGSLVERWTRLDSHVKLTKRELQLLVLASNGATSPQIAGELLISPSTVKTHFDNIRFKLAVPDRAAAVAVAIRSGMIV